MSIADQLAEILIAFENLYIITVTKYLEAKLIKLAYKFYTKIFFSQSVYLAD